jgi:hypothetical protein
MTKEQSHIIITLWDFGTASDCAFMILMLISMPGGKFVPE